jgi:hypothetical protein
MFYGNEAWIELRFHHLGSHFEKYPSDYHKAPLIEVVLLKVEDC